MHEALSDFETIHSFLNGKGRTGRLLVSLLLKEFGLLKDDLLYISYYLKQNRYEYYDRLMMSDSKDIMKHGYCFL